MTTPFQIAIDAADPHRAQPLLGGGDGLRDRGPPRPDQRAASTPATRTADDTIEIDGRLAWRTAAACRDPDGVGPRLLFQQVPEPKTVKNRVHLDLHVGERPPGGRGRAADRRSARPGSGTASRGRSRWVTLADPEGNEFCVA